MESTRYQNSATIPVEVLALDSDGNPKTGLTDVLLLIRDISTGYFFDFNDGTFKASGHVDIDKEMAEIDATNDAGKYKYDFNTSGLGDTTYELRSTCASADNFPQIGEAIVGGYVDNLDAAVSSRSSHGDPDPSGYIDAAISSRSSHAAADIWSVATRTLTSFGTLIADIWANVTRTLTAGTKDAEIDAIKAKTDNLPTDPASESSLTTINGIVTDTRRIVKNKLTIDEANSKLQLWDDAGTSVLYEWTLTDKDSTAISLTSGPPANRGVPA